ncbi:MAG: hypothetical protein K6G33_04065 [Ruminococcus sp.]|uniref:hypothetical protein n=1 Tax=Ruminococcus sp. TaxID=41978 RepID=UPI0025FD6F2D|nr:hypothetical protein [Ruminococcus sp.]MCR5599903.1 hypothetical protein [Ruminococcus sp.]
MKKIRPTKSWIISIIIVALCSAVFIAAELMGKEIPDKAIRVIGLVGLVSILVLVFSTIRSIRNMNIQNDEK